MKWICLFLIGVISQSAIAGPITFGLPAAGSNQRARQSLSEQEKQLRERLAKIRDDPYLLHRLGTLLFYQGKQGAAVAAWNTAAHREANLAPAELQLIFELLRAKDFKRAESALREAEAKYGENSHFFLARAELALRRGKVDDAESALKAAAEVKPELLVTSLSLVRFYEARRNPGEIRRYLAKAVKQAPKRGEFWSLIAAHYFNIDQIPEAVESFRKAASLEKSQTSAEANVAQLYLKSGDLIGARRWFLRSLAEKPKNDSAIRIALGQVQMRLGLNSEAKKQFKAALEMEADGNVNAVLLLAQLAQSNREWNQAEKLYRRAIKLDPKSPIALNNMAMLLFQRNLAPDEAFRFATAARQQLPNNPAVLGTYACIVFQSGDDELAVQLLAQVVRLTPSDPWIRYAYGRLLLQEKQPAEAHVHLEACLILDPDFPRKTEVRDLLDRIDR